MKSPEGFLPATASPAEREPPPVPDFTPGADSFALELRAESIEQLCGGDALRRGESERIEAGGSDGNADLVTGCDRVQVQDTLSEHTGHGLALQAAHLHATVGGSFDTRAGQEDTVLLAGHMRDTWNGGTVTVAAMTDDTAGGGGVRTNALDLWVHGLMGLEERPGTCTADAVLAEVCGTLYEREYRSAVHAAGLAVFNGALYQSVRNSFRPLMRVSMGVRNLIAGGGGGSRGDVPCASPPPAAGGAGAQGAQAATDTLAAGRGAAETPPPSTGAVHLDAAAELTREAGGVTVAEDVSELRHCTDAAERLGGLRDALRRAEVEAGAEATSGVRASETGAAAPGRRADDPGLLDGQPAAAALDPVVSTLQADEPTTGTRKTRLGLLGGGGNSPGTKPGDFDWTLTFGRLNADYRSYLHDSNAVAVRAYRDAMAPIEAQVIETFVESGGNIGRLAEHPYYVRVPDRAYRTLLCMASQAEDADDWTRADAIRQTLDSIDQRTYEIAQALAARRLEFGRVEAGGAQGVRLDPTIDAAELESWIQVQIDAAQTRYEDARRSGDVNAEDAELSEFVFFDRARRELANGVDPRASSYNSILLRAAHGDPERVANRLPSHTRLVEAVDLHRRPPIETVPPQPATLGQGAAGGIGALQDVLGPVPESSHSGPSPAVDVGADVGGGTSGDGGAVATAAPHRGAESTFWLRPVDPGPAPGTVQFDTGLQRAGQQPEAYPHAPGEAAGPRPPAGTSAFTREPDYLDISPSWAQDAFAVERALNSGRLPVGFDASTLIRDWRDVAARTPIAGQLESHLLPISAIDGIIDEFRSQAGEQHATAHIQRLGDMRKAIADALAAAYPNRTDPDWLARVAAFLNSRRVGQAVQPAPVPQRSDALVEATQASSRPVALETAAASSRTEAGVGTFPPAIDPWHEEMPGMSSGHQPVRFGTERPVRPGDERDLTTPAGAPQGSQVGETPGLGRLGWGTGGLPFSRRKQLVHRLMRDEPLSSAQRTALLRRFDRASRFAEIGPSAPRRWGSVAVLADLRRLRTAARRSTAAAAGLENIDWNAIDALLRLHDVSNPPA